MTENKETQPTPQANAPMNTQAPEPKKPKMVKMIAKAPIRLERMETINGREFVNHLIIQPGKEFMATEEEAKDFEKKLEQHHAFAGTRFKEDGEVRCHMIQRAQRI